MNFQTIVDISPSERKISYTDKIMSLGSCFTENIAAKLSQLKFNSDINPFGIVYNPVSLLNCIEILHAKKVFAENDLFYENGLWKSFYHHSRFCHPEKDVALNNINDRISSSSHFLKTADFIFITLGTAYVYEHKKTGSIVSNCHKVLSSNFNHNLLTVDEVFESLYRLILITREQNPEVKFIFTISPVRHFKYGAHKNQLSKSILHVALQKLIEKFSFVGYFPAYEIMLDELRDYRFYANDMLHPSDLAINYIWQKFSETYFDENTLKISKDIEIIVKASHHRPMFPDSEEYKKYKDLHYTKVCELEQKHPEINLSLEKIFFSDLC